MNVRSQGIQMMMMPSQQLQNALVVNALVALSRDNLVMGVVRENLSLVVLRGRCTKIVARVDVDNDLRPKYGYEMAATAPKQ